MRQGQRALLPALLMSRIPVFFRYIEWICLLVVCVLYFVLDFTLRPFERQFAVSDLNISHPYAEHEQIPTEYLGIIGILGPIVVIFCVAAWKRSPVLARQASLGLLYSTMLTGLLVTLTKNAVGRPRPDFLDRCKPLSSAPTNKLVTVAICTTDQKNKRLLDGMRSFPSGHTSFSFSGLGYLALFLAAQLKLNSRFSAGWKFVIPVIPLALAGWVGLTRSQDYRHHKEDIVVGGLFGMLMAFAVYRQYFPSIGKTDSDVTYAEFMPSESSSIRSNTDNLSHAEAMV
ncbi:phosphatidic acid phosphatase [Schizosaccharomyces japonicus yFS275]|uniref:Phosphatidic acid phosphatase n=1 Tax=Schizosaccharomyces japonicus (strain yFS275 / FY16936) TaxID=402676 RepID=B6K289_SCHJY|nr:phosphatidic acid phosphatase [Schizosaccharomyces japonicus yFS275]EEB07270.2 phosphatidic acid phosphatase [Schizosaccharomyces japonicus yFS275]